MRIQSRSDQRDQLAKQRLDHLSWAEPEFHWEHGAITVVVMLAIALGVWGLI